MEDLQGHSGSGGSAIAQEQLVPSPPLTGTSPGTDSQPESTKRAYLSFILADLEATLDNFYEIRHGESVKF